MEIFLNKFVIGAFVGLTLAIIGRILNDEKLKKTGLIHGRFISRYFGGKFGKKIWEKIENSIQKFGFAYFHGLWQGLDEDDKIKK